MKLRKIGELSKCRGQGAGGKDLSGSPLGRGWGWVTFALENCPDATVGVSAEFTPQFAGLRHDCTTARLHNCITAELQNCITA